LKIASILNKAIKTKRFRSKDFNIFSEKWSSEWNNG